MHLSPGMRYVQDGHVYVVRQLLLDHRIVIEDQTMGGQSIVAEGELATAWGCGALTFEVRGPHTERGEQAPLLTVYTIADFHLLPTAQRAEAWRRYTLILPLLALPPRERTRRTIQCSLAAAGVHHSTAVAGRDPPATSAASVERYLRAFEQSGGDIRALVPATVGRGAGRSRIDPQSEQVIQDVLAACLAAPTYRTLRDVYLLVVNRVGEHNLGRPAGDHLPFPSRNTVYRRVRAAGAPAILRRRPSRLEAQASAAVQPGPRPTRPLERVEIDHTPLDLIIVDEEDRLPIGRPTLTLALDVYTGFPTGVHVSFEPAGYAAVMRCLLHNVNSG